MSIPVKLHRLGKVSYKEAWDFQQELFDQKVQQKLENRKGDAAAQKNIGHDLIICEHPHVYTLGKSGDVSHLLIKPEKMAEAGIDFFKINRGGDITYHGPGQIVIYPILDMDEIFTDIHKYLRYLEEAVIQTLAHYGLKGDRYDGFTGVWLDPQVLGKERKICAMGVKCSRWVTMHGLALNVNPDLMYFSHIVPCGIEGKQVTSLAKELKSEVPMQEVQEVLLNELAKLFDFMYI